jgi:hypothetical protein
VKRTLKRRSKVLETVKRETNGISDLKGPWVVQKADSLNDVKRDTEGLKPPIWSTHFICKLYVGAFNPRFSASQCRIGLDRISPQGKVGRGALFWVLRLL